MSVAVAVRRCTTSAALGGAVPETGSHESSRAETIAVASDVPVATW